MIFDLADDDRAALERVRVKLGSRSHAEALRVLIRDADGQAKVTPEMISAALATMRKTAFSVAPVRPPTTTARVDVPVLARKPFNPQPKKGKAKP